MSVWLVLIQSPTVLQCGPRRLSPAVAPLPTSHNSSQELQENVGEQHSSMHIKLYTKDSFDIPVVPCMSYHIQLRLHDNALTLVCTQYHNGCFHHRHFHCVCLIFVWYVPVFTRWVLFGLLRWRKNTVLSILIKSEEGRREIVGWVTAAKSFKTWHTQYAWLQDH